MANPLDLIRGFTARHLAETKAAEEKKNPLGIPNPRNVKPELYGSLFLDLLPAELREKIFKLVVQGRVLIKGSKPNKEFDQEKAVWRAPEEKFYRPKYRLSHVLDNDDIDNGFEVSLNLLLVSKKVHQEAVLLMYSQLTFCFTSTKVIHKFLDNTPDECIKKIKKLELHHEGYGLPKFASDFWAKTKHDLKWRATCQRIANDLPALASLKLNIGIPDANVTMHSQDYWFRTLLRLRLNDRLERVEVGLRHKTIEQDRLWRAARRIEDRMMTTKGQRLRDEKEANRLIAKREREMAEAAAARRERLKSLPPVQAKSILKIVVKQEVKDDAEEAPKKEEKKYFNSKLHGYAREWKYGEGPCYGVW